MAVSYVDAGTRLATTTGTKNVAYPATTTSGNLLLLVIANKDGANTADTPSGWTVPANNTASGGAGTDGVADEGTCRVSVFYKTADGTEGGTNLSINVTATSKPMTARIYQFSKSSGSWSVACATGTKDSGGSTAYSITTGSDPGVASGDIVQACTVINSDAYLYSSESFTTSGVTYGANTELDDSGNTNGTQIRFLVNQAAASSGTSAGNTTFAATASGSATSAPAGPTVIVRIRESSGGTLTDVDTDETIVAGQDGVLYTGTGLSTADGLLVKSGTKSAAATSFVATNATSGMFSAPSLNAVLTGGVKFGSVTFDIQDGGVSLATLSGTLNPISRYTVHNVTDITQAGDGGCIYYGQDPAIAVGDQIIHQTTTTQGWTVSIDSQGFYTVDSGGSTAKTSFDYYVYDATDETWGAIGTITINEDADPGFSSGPGRAIARSLVRAIAK